MPYQALTIGLFFQNISKLKRIDIGSKTHASFIFFSSDKHPPPTKRCIVVYVVYIYHLAQMNSLDGSTTKQTMVPCRGIPTPLGKRPQDVRGIEP
jgi:hypothetical protein